MNDDDPRDHQGDKEEQVYEAGNDDDHNDNDDDASDDNPHDNHQGDTEERVYEGGKLHGTATFTSHTGDREERLPSRSIKMFQCPPSPNFGHKCPPKNA